MGLASRLLSPLPAARMAAGGLGLKREEGENPGPSSASSTSNDLFSAAQRERRGWG